MAFLGIKVPVPTARLLSDIDLPGKKVGVHEMHITILLFEENWPISEIAQALESTYDIVSKFKPFQVKTKKISSFPAREGKPYPIIALAESKELMDLCKKLKRKFNKDDIDFDKTFKDFKPHITLAYSDDKFKDCKIDSVEFTVQELVLWGGDHGDSRIFITFPLKSPEKHSKSELLLQKADLFYKLAQNPDINFLTPSRERRKTDRDLKDK